MEDYTEEQKKQNELRALIQKDMNAISMDSLEGILKRSLYVVAQYWTPDSDIKKIRKYAKAFSKIEEDVYEYTGALEISKNWKDVPVDIIAEQIREQLIIPNPWDKNHFSFDVLAEKDGTMIIKPKFL